MRREEQERRGPNLQDESKINTRLPLHLEYRQSAANRYRPEGKSSACTTVKEQAEVSCTFRVQSVYQKIKMFAAKNHNKT